jgi:signal transduction histidine kinase
MTIEMRKTGVDVVGDMPWGTHFCLFYETTADLLETSVSYCKAGLESHEFCLWVVAEPLAVEDARRALKQAVPDFDLYFAHHSIEIVAARDWYLQDGTFDLNRVIAGWNEKLARASARGYAGVRVTGDTAWLEKKDWRDFCEYEDSINQAIANQRLTALCTYPLAACGASEILDVVRTHQFAVTKRRGTWDVIETAGHKQAKAEIKRLNEELEQRVVERTSQLTAVNSELTKEVLERQRAEEKLQRLSGKLIRLQDEERRKIARDLHDSTGQDLVALATMLSQLRSSIPSAQRKSRRLLSECKALADGCIREIRTLSYVLHPPALDQAGLGDAIRDYVTGFTRRSGIQVELELSPRFGRMTRDVELALFRVVQESLTNIQRHSGSQQAKIRIHRNSHLGLEISDLGNGTSAREQGAKEEPRLEVGVGIPSMQERVKLIGGQLDIDSTSHGTTVRVTIPLERNKSEKAAHSGG